VQQTPPLLPQLQNLLLSQLLLLSQTLPPPPQLLPLRLWRHLSCQHRAGLTAFAQLMMLTLMVLLLLWPRTCR
jgi:hypothetical protein